MGTRNNFHAASEAERQATYLSLREGANWRGEGRLGGRLLRLARLLRAKALGGRRSPQLQAIKLLLLIALEGPQLQAPLWQRSCDFLGKVGREAEIIERQPRPAPSPQGPEEPRELFC